MASVTLSGVNKHYGTVEVIPRIDLKIEDGEFVVLVGPSGCGKSTLLRMIAGLEAITRGDLAIGDRLVNSVAAKNRDIAMVFQNYALYPHKNVRQNIEFALKLRKMPKEETARRVAHAADLLELTPLLERFPRQLSGGQRQRVAMGRAIVRDPAVFLFDEPLSNLDAKLRVEMRAQIKALHARLETTSIYVTHDQIEAMTMGDKIVVMRDGVVQQYGSPLEVYDRPANVFVAGFIGSPSMNLLPATRVSAGIDILGMVFPMAVARGEGPSKIIAGFRPEYVAISDNGEGLKGIIELIEPMGGETVCSVKVGDRPITVLYRDRLQLKVGQNVVLRPDMTAAHLFDAESGERLT
jgi:multiple sugar transport system ATP-binding protein